MKNCKDWDWYGYSNMVCGRILYWLVWLACGWRYDVQWLQSRRDVSRLRLSGGTSGSLCMEQPELTADQLDLVVKEKQEWSEYCAGDSSATSETSALPYVTLPKQPRMHQTARTHHTVPCVYVCNHQDAIDVLSMGALWPGRVIVIGKESLRWYPLLGTYMVCIVHLHNIECLYSKTNTLKWLSANVFIRRTNREKAIEALNEAAAQVRRRKVSILLSLY